MKDRAILSPLQKSVASALQERCCWLTAEAATENWKRGTSYYLDTRLQCPRWLCSQFQQANAEAGAGKRRDYLHFLKGGSV